MFGFLKKRREMQEAQTKIKIDLHRQILGALQSDEHSATARLNSSFTVGYIYAFVRCGFMRFDIDVEKKINAQIRYICDGAFPKELYKIFSAQATALEFARQMKNQNKKILNTELSPADVAERFALGVQAGTYDAPLVSLQAMPPDNLRRFLLKETLNLQ